MTTPSEVLRAGFARHTWATLRLIDHLERLDAASCGTGIPGTYGPIPATLTHLVDADDRYLKRMEQPVLPPYVESPPQPLATLRARVTENSGRWTTMLDALDAGELHSRLDRTITGGDVIDPAETLLLLQALHHGDDHRAQICSTLGALGLDVPDLDVWTYWAEARSG